MTSTINQGNATSESPWRNLSWQIHENAAAWPNMIDLQTTSLINHDGSEQQKRSKRYNIVFAYRDILCMRKTS